MTFRPLLTALCLVFFNNTAWALEKISIDNACNYYGDDETLPKQDVITLPPDKQTEEIIQKILAAYGLPYHFVVRSAGVPNALATIENGKQYILYSSSFVHDLTEKTHSTWPAVAVLAHEISHHLSGHTLDKSGSRPDTEIEADQAAGNVMQKMGATLAEAKLALEQGGSERATATHPAKTERLNAIANGWIASEQNFGKIEPHELVLTPIPVVTAPVTTQTVLPPQVPANAQVPKMVSITGGCFQMGSPDSEPGRGSNEKQHEVCVDDFQIAETEVTRGQFKAFVEATGYKTDAEKSEGCPVRDGNTWKFDKNRNWREPGFGQTDAHPVSCVSWNDAQAYIAWLSKPPGRSYRLPTEVEWEYAARGGSQTAYFWSNKPEEACAYANVADLAYQKQFPSDNAIINCLDDYAYTAPIKSFKPNAYGLYDMTGNVWEWVQDTYGDYDSKVNNNPKGPADGDYRVLRGGSWSYYGRGARAACRRRNLPDGRWSSSGFRLALGQTGQ